MSPVLFVKFKFIEFKTHCSFRPFISSKFEMLDGVQGRGGVLMLQEKVSSWISPYIHLSWCRWRLETTKIIFIRFCFSLCLFILRLPIVNNKSFPQLFRQYCLMLVKLIKSTCMEIKNAYWNWNTHVILTIAWN